MATSTTAHPSLALPPDTDPRRALTLRRRLLPLAAAWALLVALPVYWIVLGETTDSVTAHGTRPFAAPWADLLSGLFLLVCLAPCVAACGLSLLAWHRGAGAPRRVLLLLPGGLAGGVVGWCADQVERGPVLAATAVLVAAMFGGAAWYARRGAQRPGLTNPVS